FIQTSALLLKCSYRLLTRSKHNNCIVVPGSLLGIFSSEEILTLRSDYYQPIYGVHGVSHPRANVSAWPIRRWSWFTARICLLCLLTLAVQTRASTGVTGSNAPSRCERSKTRWQRFHRRTCSGEMPLNAP